MSLRLCKLLLRVSLLSRIKLCPRCGGTPVIVQGDNDTIQVKCWWDLSCRFSTNWCTTEEQAIAEWNADNPMPEYDLEEECVPMNFYDFTLDPDQEKFVKAVMSPENISVFCNAKAGTGKTTIAMGIANILVKEKPKEYEAISYIVSPYAEQKQGFLPGGLSQKSRPYFSPALDAIKELGLFSYEVICTDSEEEENDFKNRESNKSGGYIHLMTHTYMRGVNLAKQVVILDEAQNFTLDDMRKVLTRIHDTCKVIVIGHTGQIDISGKSGFAKYIKHYRTFEGSAECSLTINHRGKFSSHADAIDEVEDE